MSGTPQAANLPAGTNAPHTGAYVVVHRNPAHPSPHEVPVVTPMVLPKCHVCSDVRFSLKGLLAQPIEKTSSSARTCIPSPPATASHREPTERSVSTIRWREKIGQGCGPGERHHATAIAPVG
jgi:hypothetical protein